ncbi:hypothetical protein [Catenovulum agarivorans]|uniref:hypothetical protein n=1 Tax=Catenovulum agarivorans TaxID=1172192 RepID=UPI0003806CE6|nr:hypothetical protein [Catenovulum agarivorans]
MKGTQKAWLRHFVPSLAKLFRAPYCGVIGHSQVLSKVSASLTSFIFEYAVALSGHRAEAFMYFFDDDSLEPLNYLLRTVVPAEFTFDGIKKVI